MRLGPVTKLDKKNKTTSKNIDGDVISVNFDAILVFLIYGQSGAIWQTHSGCLVCETYIFVKSSLLSYKNWKQT